MDARVHACCLTLAEQQKQGGPCDGGWGRRSFDDATLSSTADALKVIGSVPHPLPASAVARVRRFTERKLRDQLENPATATSTHQISAGLRIHHELRGRPEPVMTESYLGALAAAQQILLGDELRGRDDAAGWAGRPGGVASLNATYHALWALDIRVHDGYLHKDVRQRVKRPALDFLLSRAERSGGAGLCWRQELQGEQPSLAASSLAVTSLLSDGDVAARAAGRSGATWLAEELTARLAKVNDAWRHWEPIADPDHDGFYPTTAMAALAWVRAQPGVIDPVPSFLREAVAALDGMWTDRSGGWDSWGANYPSAGATHTFVGTSRTIVSLRTALMLKGVVWDDLATSAGTTGRRARTPRAESVFVPEDEDRLQARLVGATLRVHVDDRPEYVRLTPLERRIIHELVDAPGGMTARELVSRTGSESERAIAKAIARLRKKFREHPVLGGLLDYKGYPVDKATFAGFLPVVDRHPEQLVLLWGIEVDD
jgi:hypothetical protein